MSDRRIVGAGTQRWSDQSTGVYVLWNTGGTIAKAAFGEPGAGSDGSERGSWAAVATDQFGGICLMGRATPSGSPVIGTVRESIYHQAGTWHHWSAMSVTGSMATLAVRGTCVASVGTATGDGTDHDQLLQIWTY